MSNSSHIDDSNLRLTPQDDKFSYPEKLKRSEMDGLDASQWEELCIAAAENELNDQQKVNALLNNEEFKQELSKYKSLKLTADKQVSYPNKNSLKKSNHKIGLWIGIAAAAVALLIAIPAAMQKTSSNTDTPRLVTTPSVPEKVEKQAQEPANKNNEQVVKNNTVVAQAENTAVQPKPKAETEVKATVAKQNDAEEKNTEPELQKVTRESLNFKTLELAQSTTPAVATTENLKPQLQTANLDVVILASASEIERIEVEKPNFFDRLKEKSIVSFNKLRGEGTMVVKEYDSDGKLTLYAVQSSTLSFEKNYTE